MTAKEFITTIEGAYGRRYKSVIMTRMIVKYVKETGIDLELLCEYVIMHFKGQYGGLPDAAAIRDMVEKDDDLSIQKRLHEDTLGNMWSRGKQIGHMDGSRFIPNYALTGVPKNVRKLDHRTPALFLAFVEEHERSLIVKNNKTGERKA